MTKQPYRRLTCHTCAGHGLVGHQIPDECPTCGGAGTIIQYRSGVLAKYYTGPLLGRAEVNEVVTAGQPDPLWMYPDNE